MAIGHFLHKHPDPHWGQQRLIILADIDGSTEVKNRIKTLSPMMQENKTDIFIDPRQIATTIKRDAKQLPESVLEFFNREKSSV